MLHLQRVLCSVKGQYAVWGVKFELSRDLFTHGRIFMEGLHEPSGKLEVQGQFYEHHCE